MLYENKPVGEALRDLMAASAAANGDRSTRRGDWIRALVPEETHRKKPTLTVAGGHGQPLDALRQYVLTLHDEREISELILKLEAVSNGDETAVQDAGIEALAKGAHLDLADRSVARRAGFAADILVGRTQIVDCYLLRPDPGESRVRVFLEFRLTLFLNLRGLHQLGRHALFEDLLQRGAKLRTGRLGITVGGEGQRRRHRPLDGARIHPFAGGQRASRTRPRRGALRSPVLMAVLLAPGLLTIPMAISTPGSSPLCWPSSARSSRT